MKPKILAIGLACISSIVFWGCGQPQPAETDEAITLEFWTLQLLNFKETLEPMFAEYEALHPGVKIKWVDVPFSQGKKRALSAMMSPEVPDVINLNPDFAATLASRKALLNMNEVAPKAVKQAYLPVAWQAVSMRTKNEQGFAVGLPWYITSQVTLYNDALLKKAGWDTPPDSFESLLKLGQDLHRQDLGYALMPSLAEGGRFLKFLLKSGAPLYNGEGTLQMSSAAAEAHLQFWAEIYQEGLIPKESLTEGHRAAVDRYQSGSLALLMTGANFLNIVKENAPDVYEQTRVASQFPAGSPVVDFATMVLVVPQKTKHPKEAVDFAAFITNKTNQLAFAQAAPVLPSVTAALEDSYFSEYSPDDKIGQARAMSARQLLNAKQAFQVLPNQGKIGEVVDYYVQLALLGKTKPKAALEALQKRVD
ncbi:MAG: extracellular solute-binding protein [Vampirovibrio sp.]|nr:extracellular solute-binding protein [Vampirovibrio sp.]